MNSGHALRYTKGNEAKNIPPRPVLPTPEDVAILRRASLGYIFVTLTKRGPEYRYDDGSKVSLRQDRAGDRQFQRMVKEGWLVPDKGDSLFPDGPPQRYRARKTSTQGVNDAL